MICLRRPATTKPLRSMASMTNSWLALFTIPSRLAGLHDPRSPGGQIETIPPPAEKPSVPFRRRRYRRFRHLPWHGNLPYRRRHRLRSNQRLTLRRRLRCRAFGPPPPIADQRPVGFNANGQVSTSPSAEPKQPEPMPTSATLWGPPPAWRHRANSGRAFAISRRLEQAPGQEPFGTACTRRRDRSACGFLLHVPIAETLNVPPGFLPPASDFAPMSQPADTISRLRPPISLRQSGKSRRRHRSTSSTRQRT